MWDVASDVRVELDPTIHSKSSLLRVAYAMADRIALDLRDVDGRFVLVGTSMPGRNAAKLVDEIRVCAIDFALREDIEANTFGMREVIWRAAFAEASGSGG
jgi:His-Xaa-Ser system protein HxsD